MRDSGPEGPEQQAAFGHKVKLWATLFSNCGFSSGHFSRLVQQGDSCQAYQGRAPEVMPSPPRAPPPPRQAPLPKAAPPPPPEPGPQSHASPVSPPQAEEDAKLAPKQVDMEQPTTEEEKMIVQEAWFGRSKSPKSTLEFTYFQYKPGFGTGLKGNRSSWYKAQEEAARAIWEWAGGRWRERVVLKADKNTREKEGGGRGLHYCPKACRHVLATVPRGEGNSSCH